MTGGNSVKAIDKYLTGNQLIYLNDKIAQIRKHVAHPVAGDIMPTIRAATDFHYKVETGDMGTSVYIIGQPLGVVVTPGPHRECVWNYYEGWLEEGARYA